MQPLLRIRQAAEILGCSASTIRKYEHAGQIPRVQRNRAGQRVYSLEDLAAIRRVLVPGEVAEPEPLRILEPEGGPDGI